MRSGHEHKQPAEPGRPQRRALEPPAEDVSPAGAVDTTSVERMQRSAGNAAVGAMLGGGAAGPSPAPSKAQRAPSSDSGGRARAAGRKAVSAISGKLGRFAGGRSAGSPSFDAVMRSVAAPAEAAPVQRAVLEDTPALADGATGGDAGGGGAAGGWGDGGGGGGNDKGLGNWGGGGGAASDKFGGAGG